MNNFLDDFDELPVNRQFNRTKMIKDTLTIMYNYTMLDDDYTIEHEMIKGYQSMIADNISIVNNNLMLNQMTNVISSIIKK